MPGNVSRAPFSRRVKNTTDFFYECAPYIKTSLWLPLYPVCSNTVSAIVNGTGDSACELVSEMLLRRIGTKPMLIRAVAMLAFLAVATPGVYSASPASRPGDQKKEQPRKEKAKAGDEKLSSM